jgi:hypothetical protein
MWVLLFLRLLEARVRNQGADDGPDARIQRGNERRQAAGNPPDGHDQVGRDAPGWTIPTLPSSSGLPGLWQLELAECWAQRRQLARIMEAVTPRLVVHGHYHSGYRHQLDTGWGRVEIAGLSEDGTAGSMTLMECSAGAWSLGSRNE